MSENHIFIEKENYATCKVDATKFAVKLSGLFVDEMTAINTQQSTLYISVCSTIF